MNLSQKTADALDAMLESAGEGTLTVEDAGRFLTMGIHANSPVGVSFDRLELTIGASPAAWTCEELRAWGERIARRVTYLLEPLVVLEVDPVGNEVELRSRAPSERGEGKSFYEIRLLDGSIRLSRYSFLNEDRRRQPTSCHVTREVLERLIDDFEACVTK